MNNDQNLKIQETVDDKLFREFLLSLTQKTLYNFNPFGNITSYVVDSIIEKEKTRLDKIKFFSLVDDELIAYSYLTRFDKPSKKHNAILGIVIKDTFQGKGLGKKICKYMIETGWKHSLTKIWLTVFHDNLRGIKLYKSLGFEIEGIFMDDEITNNQARNVISMAIFKNTKGNQQEREKIWNELESF